jgi:hypothetical protein
MKPMTFIFCALIVFAGLLFAAVVWDSVHSLDSRLQAVALVDEQLQQSEKKLLRALDSLPTVPADIAEVKQQYLSAKLPGERHRQFHNLASATERALQADFKPDDPVRRRLSDDVEGVINRYRITEPDYLKAVEEYNSLSKSQRGSWAHRFSNYPLQLDAGL